MIVDQSNFYFVVRQATMNFGAAMDLMRYLADEQHGHYIAIQSRIDDRLKADVVARDWKRRRTLLRDAKNFRRYRGKHYDEYHTAARARHIGKANSAQLTLANGLESEIQGSNIVIPTGQILFHGRANHDLDAQQPYPSFVSTSLDPVVARTSAIRRAGVSNVNGPPTVYVLTSRATIPALWGHVGKSFEYELLLPPGRMCTVLSTYSGKNFQVVEADIA